jgi:methylated-DNA-protein-cysteine methyltransferase related protein
VSARDGAPPPPNAEPSSGDRELTAFQAAVADVVASLRPGELVTYRDVAEEVGRPGSAQAVANVLRAVPGLPWWRVLPADGRLYCSHAPTQAPLLEAEGHRVDHDRRVAPTGGRLRSGIEG